MSSQVLNVGHGVMGTTSVSGQVITIYRIVASPDLFRYSTVRQDAPNIDFGIHFPLFSGFHTMYLILIVSVKCFFG